MCVRKLAAAGGLLLSVAAAPAMAGSLVIELYEEYSGGALPAGTPAWARATFTDTGSGTVNLVLECLLQSTKEFMAKATGGGPNPHGWAFNLDPALNPNHLVFSHESGRTASAIHTGANQFKAGPDRFYDFLFQFGAGLKGGDVSVYNLSITSGMLSAASFDFVTTSGSGLQTGFHSAAHVQGIDDSNGRPELSGWIGGGVKNPEAVVIPLPTAGAMGLAGLGILAGRRRRGIA